MNDRVLKSSLRALGVATCILGVVVTVEVVQAVEHNKKCQQRIVCNKAKLDTDCTSLTTGCDSGPTCGWACPATTALVCVDADGTSCELTGASVCNVYVDIKMCQGPVEGHCVCDMPPVGQHWCQPLFTCTP